MYVPLKVPPGVYKNGTQLQSEGRWNDANLIRWYEGTLRPVGGWRKRIATQLSGRACGLLTWRSNNLTPYIAVGTHTKLYALENGTTLVDITPTGLTVGRADSEGAAGYGIGPYGVEPYGIARSAASSGGVLDATTWSMDSWGEYLLACASTDGKIYEWALNNANDALALTNAPTGNRAVVVSAERFVFALGAGGNPRKVQWSDQEANTVWTPTATNEAGSLELVTLGKIMAGRRLRSGVLILTDVDAHMATYVGPPFVYGIEKVGSGCGLIGQNAVAAVETFAVWMGQSGFWVYDGYVKPLQCEVSDYVYSNLNRGQLAKVHAVHNSAFGEVWWFYPSAAGLECDQYVVWNYREQHWSVGALARTIGSGQGVFDLPILVSTDGYVYEHEVGFNYDGAVLFAETGPLQVANGDRILSVRQLIPDEKTAGDVRALFKLRQYPNATERTVGPFSMSSPTDVRFAARQVRMRIEAARNADWRVGVMRLEAVAGERR